MLRIVSMFKIANKYGAEWLPSPRVQLRFLDKSEAQTEIDRISEEARLPIGWLIATSCFALELQSEKGEPVYFDLGNPLVIQRANTETTTSPPRSESVPDALKT